MRKSARRRFALLWALAALLLGAGVYATLSASQAAPPTGSPAQTVGGAGEVQVVQEVGEGEVPIVEGGGTSLRQLRDDIATPWHARLVSVLGLGTMILLAWLMSANRRLVPWRLVAWGIGLQFAFALIILRTPVGAAVFDGINTVIVGLLGYTQEGASFLFGNLVSNAVPVTTEAGAAAGDPVLVAQTGAFFAFNVLPTIIFFSSLMTILYHLGVMQRLVRGVAWVMMRTMRTSGAETLSAAGNIFMGQTESPLLIKPFVARMTNSELMAVMIGGFATVAGGVMAA
jgi:CNT family concentrative nucleoside transporter